MVLRFGVFLLSLLLASLLVAQAQTPPPPAVTTPDPCATAVPELPNDLPTAFAYELESPGILALMSELKTLPPRDRVRVFNAVADAAASPAEQDRERAHAAICPDLETIYATSRALYLVVNLWKLGEFANAKRFDAFATVIGSTVKALANPDRAASGEQVALLAPFAAADAGRAPAALALPAARTCAGPDAAARPDKTVSPDTPPLAAVAVTTGNANVLISLSETGEVRSARILSNTLKRGLGSDDIIRAAILSAAESTYFPAIKDCRAVASKGVLVVTFGRR